jgi:mutator protein MutT
MIYQDRPKVFAPKFKVVSCFVEYNGQILLLHRQDHKPQGNTWGVPAGKVDDGETIGQTMVREIQEETGFELPPAQLSYFGRVYVKYPDYDFIYHMFHAKLDHGQKVAINHQEHKAFKWITPVDALNMRLIQDLDACIKLFYFKNQKNCSP